MRSPSILTGRNSFASLREWTADTAENLVDQLNLDFDADRLTEAGKLVYLLTAYAIEHRTVVDLRRYFQIGGPLLGYFASLSHALLGDTRGFCLEISKMLAQVCPSATEADCSTLLRRSTPAENLADSFTIFFNHGPWFYKKGVYTPIQDAAADSDDLCLTAQSEFVLLVARWLSEHCPAALPALRDLVINLEDIDSYILDVLKASIEQQKVLTDDCQALYLTGPEDMDNDAAKLARLGATQSFVAGETAAKQLIQREIGLLAAEIIKQSSSTHSDTLQKLLKKIAVRDLLLSSAAHRRKDFEEVGSE